jgi:octanoyl-[GcvH]:protein N-octanoyltransferase
VSAGRVSAPGLTLYTDSPADAALDVAVSHALLRDAAERGVEAARVWVPPPAVSFGRLDLLRQGRGAAVAAALEAGLQPVRRLAGGRAAAIGPGTVCLGCASPSPELAGMQARYEALSELIVAALGSLGVAARIGELAGEWCPGAWSVLVGGRKVAGLAQRVIRGGAWAEAVIVAVDPRELAGALDAVQRALGMAWDPATLGGLDGVGVEPVRAALIGALQSRRALNPEPLPAAVWARAGRLRAEHDLVPR